MSLKKLSEEIISWLFILLILYFAIFQLPSLSPKKIHTVTGNVDTISIKSTANKGHRKWIFFNLNEKEYYFTLTSVVENDEIDTVVNYFREYERMQLPITIAVTEEKDYRDTLSVGKRIHAVELDGNSMHISISAYKKDVRGIRFMFLAIATFLLAVKLIIYFL